MTEEEKKAQLLNQTSSENADAPDDSETMIPPTLDIKLGGKLYTIKALPLKYMKIFEKISKNASSGRFDNDEYDLMLQLISKAIDEPSIDFIEENVTAPEVHTILQKTFRISMHGMPNPQGGAKGNGHGGKA